MIASYGIDTDVGWCPLLLVSVVLAETASYTFRILSILMKVNDMISFSACFHLIRSSFDISNQQNGWYSKLRWQIPLVLQVLALLIGLHVLMSGNCRLYLLPFSFTIHLSFESYSFFQIFRKNNFPPGWGLIFAFDCLMFILTHFDFLLQKQKQLVSLFFSCGCPFFFVPVSMLGYFPLFSAILIPCFIWNHVSFIIMKRCHWFYFFIDGIGCWFWRKRPHPMFPLQGLHKSFYEVHRSGEAVHL